MTYAIDTVRILILDGWRLAPVASAAGVLLAFDACAVVLAALALRRGLR
jgi:ABC-type multidrug transport system permease subunit